LTISTLATGAGALAAVAAPAVALHRLLRLPLDAALVLPVGWALTSFLYWLSLLAGLPWLYPAALASCLLVLLYRPGGWLLAEGPGWSGTAAPMAALVAFLAVTSYGWNRPGPAGEFVLDPLVPYDTAFHVGVTHELAAGWPPQVPGLSGFPLHYHLGADLTRAAALRWFEIDPYDALTRVETTLGALALVLLLRAVAWRLGAPAAAVALVPFTLLATDFSFAFAGNVQAHWWADMLRGNLLLSLDLANPVVPALALALGALLALTRSAAGEGRGWLLLALVQATAVPFFKVFLGAHLLLGLGVAYLLAPAAVRRAVLLLAAASALGTALVASGAGGGAIEVAWAPFDLAMTTRDALGLSPLHGAALLAWAGLWLAASLGLRLLGLPDALRALRPGASPLAAATAAMALTGWPLGLLMRVSAPEALAGQRIVNDAAFLVEQSGPLLWVFTAIALARWAGSGRRRAIVLAAAATLALPSTVQFVVQKSRWPNQAIPASRVRAMRALEAVSHPGDVVLQRPGGRYPPAPVVLIGRRVPYERFTPWLTQFALRPALEVRHETVYRFFRTRDPDEARAIASDLGARFLCLYDAERVRFEASGLLEPVYLEPDVRVYRITTRR
jgi:hypothetical protein